MFEVFSGISRTSNAPARFLTWQGCKIDADIGNGGRWWLEMNVGVGYKALKWKQKCKRKSAGDPYGIGSSLRKV